jgi:hypothetical protein
MEGVGSGALGVKIDPSGRYLPEDSDAVRVVQGLLRGTGKGLRRRQITELEEQSGNVPGIRGKQGRSLTDLCGRSGRAREAREPGHSCGNRRQRGRSRTDPCHRERKVLQGAVVAVK